MRIDFARLNHILIPKTKDERDRFRNSLFGRAAIRLFGVWGSLTDEGRTLALVTPVVGAVAVDAQRTSAYFVFSILVGLIVGSLLAARSLRLEYMTVRVSTPRRVVVGDEVTFGITCHREGTGAPANVRVRGPFLTWDGKWAGATPDEMVVAPGETVTATMRARFTARGLHHLDPFTAGEVAPLGLACGPRVSSDGVKFCVVPRIANIVRLPLAIATKHQPGGVALASKAGESMDLLGVRPYRPGDPVRDLHARTWARTGQPAIREYQQEYFTRVGVVLDTSTRDSETLEVAIELAAGVVAYLSRFDALIDVLVVGDVVHELTVGRSLGWFDQALELLAATTHGPKLDAAKLMSRLGPHLGELSSVIVITPEGGAEEERRALERKLHDRGLRSTFLAIDPKLAKSIRSREALAW